MQDLPPETAQRARECKAFVRAKKVKTPEHLLRVVFFHCGLDTSWREVAGTLTALCEAITDPSVAERSRACGPWMQALLRQMLPLAQGDTLPAGAALWSWMPVVCKPQEPQAPTLRAFLMVANKGQLRRRRPEELTHQALCLNLVTNAVIVWNTVSTAAVIAQLTQEGYSVHDSDLAHVWPTRYAHLNVYGKYHFSVEEGWRRQGLLPGSGDQRCRTKIKSPPSCPAFSAGAYSGV